MIQVRRPTPDQLERLRASSEGAPLTYTPAGVTLTGRHLIGYRRDVWGRPIGVGDETFERARVAIDRWAVHRGAGLIVAASGPPRVDEVVALSAPLPVGWIDAVCRIVAVVDEASRFGFAYGTLPTHPEQGEEAFVVERADDGTISFVITAESRPRHPLARIAPPIARRLQSDAVERYLDAMAAAVG